MNVFYLDPDPQACARMHIDKHVVKMIIEYAQLLSTAHRVIDGEYWTGRTTNGRRIARYFHPDPIANSILYKATHINHPSAKWVRESDKNYEWLYNMWYELCNEYTYRYARKHATFEKLEYPLVIPPLKISTEKNFSEPPAAMGEFSECIVKDNAVESYRNYYWTGKRSFAKWTRRSIPDWWKQKAASEI